MFELPQGQPFEDDFSLEEGTLLPFAHGAITTTVGRRKTPSGHRLVRGGKPVAWMAKNANGDLLGGLEARLELERLERESKTKWSATVYTIRGLGEVADAVPEAFEHQADRQGLGARVNHVERLLARDLSFVVEQLAAHVTVRGALAMDGGLLIDHAGDLPGLGEAEAVCAHLHDLLSGMNAESLATELGLHGQGHITLHSDKGSLLLAQSGTIALAAWTEKDANHARLLSGASLALEGELGAAGHGGAALPEGFTLRDGKGGPDAVISMLKAAMDESVTGHLQAGASSKAVSIVLDRGVPVACWAPAAESMSEAMQMFTDPKRKLKLIRFPSGTIVSQQSGTVEGFALATFCSDLATTRTRSEARQTTLTALLNEAFGFEMGLQQLKVARSTMAFMSSGAEVAEALPVMKDQAVAAMDAGLRRRLEKSQQREDALTREKAKLERKVAQLDKQRNAADIIAREASEARQEHTVALEDANASLNRMQVDLAQARTVAEEADARAERLMRRVNELEHQVSERAAELAKALGESSSSAALHTTITDLSLKEAELKANLDEGGQRLSSVRQQSDDEERRLRVLTEQVSTARERHARVQAELLSLQEQVHLQQVELDASKAEVKAAQVRLDEDRERRSEEEARRSHVQAELRELMDERRVLLRELGDLGARRGHAEAELSSMVNKATALAEAHEEALADIKEAERLRARLAEEPLAQALLNDHATFEGLGPVLNRLEHARTLGYSVTMLDRAVERSLQVIQATVDHVASTPRHLLSSEVMTLLERQVPQTAGAVRGLARWSVQQRLEHQLGETVNQVVLDLEHLLEDYDRSITMLRRIRHVLEQVHRLGAPEHEVRALLANCQRPEALPSLAQGTRRLIQVALDDIYLEADQRNAGEAMALEETAKVLEELISQIDASGLADGIPQGQLWDFQRDGLLPFERESVPEAERLPVTPGMLEDLEPHLLAEDHLEVAATAIAPDVDDEGWSTLPAPNTEETAAKTPTPTTVDAPVAAMTSEEDERASLEAELARIDAAWSHREANPSPLTSAKDTALTDLEARLSELEF